MRAVVQRVSQASVAVAGRVVGAFDEPGLLVFVGASHEDTPQTAAKLAAKLWGLRILRGELSCSDTAAPLMVISQQDPDHDGARAGSSARTWKPPPSRGPAWSWPPSADTRSRMPTRPSPGPDGRAPELVTVLISGLVTGLLSGPSPSSSTWIETVSGV